MILPKSKTLMGETTVVLNTMNEKKKKTKLEM
jgi:hypothetical protein